MESNRVNSYVSKRDLFRKIGFSGLVVSAGLLVSSLFLPKEYSSKVGLTSSAIAFASSFCFLTSGRYGYLANQNNYQQPIPSGRRGELRRVGGGGNN